MPSSFLNCWGQDSSYTLCVSTSLQRKYCTSSPRFPVLLCSCSRGFCPSNCPFSHSQHKEQQKEQVSLGEASGTAEDAVQYLHQWRSVMAEHTAALEELQERLDQAALDDLRILTVSLSEKATEELRRLQSTAMTQELLKRSAPWLFLQQILEEHSRESAARTTQLEAEERERGQELVQGVRQRLQQDAPETYTEEQAELRRWEHLVFM